MSKQVSLAGLKRQVLQNSAGFYEDEIRVRWTTYGESAVAIYVNGTRCYYSVAFSGSGPEEVWILDYQETPGAHHLDEFITYERKGDPR